MGNKIYYLAFLILLISCNKTDELGYKITKSAIYFVKGNPPRPVEIIDADVLSFKILDTTKMYAKDKNSVYFLGDIIKDADPNSFELLEKPYYTKGKNYVYLSSTKFCSYPETFSFIGNYYCKNKKYVYRPIGRGDKVTEDINNFKLIKEEGLYDYAIDSKFAYVNGMRIEKVNINAYKPIKQGFSKDDKQIFYLDKKMPISDYPSFEIVQLPYSKDNYRAYFRDFIIEKSDPKTFKILNLDASCSCDTTHAYFKNEIIKKADMESIKKGLPVIGCNENEVFFGQFD
jgi:hypothetical protein